MAGKERGDNVFTHSFIHSYIQACVCAFIHSTSCLASVRHCPRHRNTKMKIVPTIEFTVREDRYV